MNFDLSEDQRLLVDTVASFVKKQSPVGRARKLREDATGWEKHVWRQMGEFGWLGVAFPEDAGGEGKTSLAFANADGRWVINGHAADHIVVADGDKIHVVDRAGAEITPVGTMDGRKAAMIKVTKPAA